MEEKDNDDHNASLLRVDPSAAVQTEPLPDDARILDRYAARTLMSHTERFEQDAMEFYQETGFIAPGKSVPLAMGPINEDERRIEWDRWCAKQSDSLRWALLAGAAALRRDDRAKLLAVMVQSLASEGYAHWDADRDMQAGKILSALAGVRGMRPQLDALYAEIGSGTEPPQRSER